MKNIKNKKLKKAIKITRGIIILTSIFLTGMYALICALMTLSMVDITNPIAFIGFIFSGVISGYVCYLLHKKAF